MPAHRRILRPFLLGVAGLAGLAVPGARLVAAPPRPNDFRFIDNGRIRLGINTHWEAGIACVSPSGSRQSRVNPFDHGRLIQQSYYGAEDGSFWDKQPWSGNPVPGGDWSEDTAHVLEIESGRDWIHARSRAKHRASDADLQEVTLEEDIPLTNRLVEVRFSFHYTGLKRHPEHRHENPAVFLESELATLALYEGPKPWTVHVGTNDRELGAYVPLARELTPSRFGDGRADYGACSYFTPLTKIPIEQGTKFTCDL